jgi:hypothetical protein
MVSKKILCRIHVLRIRVTGYKEGFFLANLVTEVAESELLRYRSKPSFAYDVKDEVSVMGL